MFDFLNDSAPLAIGVALSPMAITAVIVLIVQGNRRGALWFLAGWLAGLTVLTAIVAIFGQGLQPQQRDIVRPWVASLKIVAGVIIVVWVIVTFIRNRNAPPPMELPKVLQAVDKFGPLKTFSMATFMAGANVKNLTFIFIFLLALVAVPRPIVVTVAFVVSFLVLASLTIAVPVLYAFISGEAGELTLAKWRTWIMVHQDTIMNGFIGIVGLVLIWRGVAA